MGIIARAKTALWGKPKRKTVPKTERLDETQTSLEKGLTEKDLARFTAPKKKEK